MSKGLVPSLATWMILSWAATGQAIPITPIVGDFGSVAPTINETSIEISRTFSCTNNPSCDAGTWFVTFSLLQTAIVNLGAFVLPPLSGIGGIGGPAKLSTIFLVNASGDVIATDTAIFNNPFPSAIVRLVNGGSLPAGDYALGVSGSGNRYFFNRAGSRDLPDYAIRLQVLVPEPGTAVLISLGLAMSLGCRRRK